MPGVDPPKPDEEKEPPEPKLRIEIVVSPSIRTMGAFYQDMKPRIWGDGVDLLFAGYYAYVEGEGWSIDDKATPSDPTFTADQSVIKKVENFEKFNILGPSNRYERPEPYRRVVIQANWSKDDRDMVVSVTATVHLKHSSGKERDLTDSDDKTVAVIGANPEIWLTADKSSVYATGEETVKVRPSLTVFGSGYGGGLTIKEVLDKARLEKFFEPKLEEMRVMGGDGLSYVDPDRFKKPQSVELRCRAKLDDKDMKSLGGDGLPISFSVEATAQGFETEFIQNDFWWMPKAHYEACAAKLPEAFPNGLTAKEPPKVVIYPSRVACDPPNPSALPKAGTGDEWISFIKGRVVSAAGGPLQGKWIKNDLTSPSAGMALNPWHFTQNWSLRLWYDAPAEEWRKSYDPGLPKEPGLTIPINDVNDAGELMFGQEPFLRYNHLQRFYNIQKKYVMAQTCVVNFEFNDKSTGAAEPVGGISIAGMDSVIWKVKFIVKTQSGDRARDVTVCIRNVDVTNFATGKTDGNGATTIEVVRPDYKFTHIVKVEGGANPLRLPDGRRLSPEGVWEYGEEHNVEVDRDGMTFEITVPSKLRKAKIIVKTRSGELMPNVVVGIRNAGVAEFAMGKTDANGQAELEYRHLDTESRHIVKVEGRTDPLGPPERRAPLARDYPAREGFDYGKEYEVQVTKDGQEIPIELPLSRQWALQSQLYFSLTTPVISVGVAGVGCFLIDRSQMPSGNVISDWDPSPTPNLWRRFWLRGGAAGLGASIVPFVDFEFSAPGATDFTTLNPVAWEDFNSSGNVGGISFKGSDNGYSASWAEIHDVTIVPPPGKPHNIDISSRVLGEPGAGVSLVAGSWRFKD